MSQFISCIAVGLALVWTASAVPGALQVGPGAKPAPALTSFIDIHTHFDGDIDGSVRAALTAMGRQNASRIIYQIPPNNVDRSAHSDVEAILAAAKKYPGKLSVLGGGASLNAMIQDSVTSGNAGPDVQQRFKLKAEELLLQGVVGFGEMTAEHFDGGTPYQYAPPDHPLFLLLADIAAQHNVPVDIHMEAVPQDMPLPDALKSPPNAPRLHENIRGFEHLLDHNRQTKIIWAHTGTDATGYRTPELCRRLLQAHSNLFMEIKTDPLNQGKNYLLTMDGKIKPEWLKLFADFPDRFIIGSDQHYPEPESPAGAAQRWQTVVLLFNQLPSGLRKQIGTENVRHIFGALR